jgi:mannose-1-phosphate guanylyltransferase
MTLYAAILAGGVGTRLWPRSRQNRPKQFSDITGSGQTMIQETVQRLNGVADEDRIFVLTGSLYADLVAEQLPQIPEENIVIEPSGRNTGPAIGLACIHLLHRDPDAVIAALPADHVIANPESFRNALNRATVAADQGYLVTLGIEPTHPHTGYGYVQRGMMVGESGPDDIPMYTVHQFLEKPSLKAAEAFLRSGDYYWNGGIFVSRADRMLAEMKRQTPDVYSCLMEIAEGINNGSLEQAMASAWERMPSISIDYGVMEQAESLAVVPLRAGWNDIGSWDALESVLMPDVHGNLTAKSDTLIVDSTNNIVYCEDKLVAMVGVDDLVVVDTGDVLLIGHRKQMQKVKDAVNILQSSGRTDLL